MDGSSFGRAVNSTRTRRRVISYSHELMSAKRNENYRPGIWTPLKRNDHPSLSIIHEVEYTRTYDALRAIPALQCYLGEMWNETVTVLFHFSQRAYIGARSVLCEIASNFIISQGAAGLHKPAKHLFLYPCIV